MTVLVFRKSVDNEDIDELPSLDFSESSGPSIVDREIAKRAENLDGSQQDVPEPWETRGGSYSPTDDLGEGPSFSSPSSAVNEGDPANQSSPSLEQSALRSSAGSEGGVDDPFRGPQEDPEQRFGHMIWYPIMDREDLDKAREDSRNLPSSSIVRNLGGHTDDAYHIAASEEVRRRLPTESEAPPVPANPLSMGGDATKLTDSELYGHLAYCREYRRIGPGPHSEQEKKEIDGLRQDYFLVEKELTRRLNHHYDTPLQQVSQSPSTAVVLKENAGEHKLLGLPDKLKMFGVERPSRATDGNEAVQPATRRELTLRLGALGIKHLINDSWWGTQKVAESFINWLDKNNETILSVVGQSPKVGSALPAQPQEATAPTGGGKYSSVLPEFSTSAEMGFAARTIENARNSDVTIDFSAQLSGSGGANGLTREAARRAGKPYVQIPIRTDGSVDIDGAVKNIALAIIKTGNPSVTLNIAGHGLSTIAKDQKRNLSSQSDADRVTLEIISRVKQQLEEINFGIKKIRTGGQSGFDESGIMAASRLGIPSLVHAPADWRYLDREGRSHTNEGSFKERFHAIHLPPDVREKFDELKDNDRRAFINSLSSLFKAYDPSIPRARPFVERQIERLIQILKIDDSAVDRTVESIFEAINNAQASENYSANPNAPEEPTGSIDEPSGSVPPQITAGLRGNEAQRRAIANALAEIKKLNPDDSRKIEELLSPDNTVPVNSIFNDLTETIRMQRQRASSQALLTVDVQQLPSLDKFSQVAEQGQSMPTTVLVNKIKSLINTLNIPDGIIDPSWLSSMKPAMELLGALNKYTDTLSANKKILQAKTISPFAAPTPPPDTSVFSDPSTVPALREWKPSKADIDQLKPLLQSKPLPYLGYRQGTPEYIAVLLQMKKLGASAKTKPSTRPQQTVIEQALAKIGFKLRGSVHDSEKSLLTIHPEWIENQRNAALLIGLLGSIATKKPISSGLKTANPVNDDEEPEEGTAM